MIVEIMGCRGSTAAKVSEPPVNKKASQPPVNKTLLHSPTRKKAEQLPVSAAVVSRPKKAATRIADELRRPPAVNELILSRLKQLEAGKLVRTKDGQLIMKKERYGSDIEFCEHHGTITCYPGFGFCAAWDDVLAAAKKMGVQGDIIREYDRKKGISAGSQSEGAGVDRIMKQLVSFDLKDELKTSNSRLLLLQSGKKVHLGDGVQLRAKAEADGVCIVCCEGSKKDPIRAPWQEVVDELKSAGLKGDSEYLMTCES